jgi:hypothetical protein
VFFFFFFFCYTHFVRTRVNTYSEKSTNISQPVTYIHIYARTNGHADTQRTNRQKNSHTGEPETRRPSKKKKKKKKSIKKNELFWFFVFSPKVAFLARLKFT